MSPSGTFAALAYDEGRLIIIDLTKNVAPKNIPIDRDTFVSSLAWSGDGLRLAAGTTTGGLLILAVDGKILAKADQKGGVALLSWATGSARLASICDGKAVCVWDAHSNGPGLTLNLVGRYYGHTGPITSLAFAAGGERLATIADAPDQTIRLWSVAANDPAIGAVSTWERQAIFTTVGVSADGHWLAAGDNKGAVHLWSFPPRGSEALLRAAGEKIEAMAWAPTSSELAAGDRNGNITIWKWPDVAMPRRIVTHEQLYALSWLTDGPKLLIGGNLDGSVSVLGPGDATPTIFDSRHHDMVYSSGDQSRRQNIARCRPATDRSLEFVAHTV